MKSKSGTKARFRELLHEAGVNFELSDRFYRDIVLWMNGAKGRTGEFLVQASVLNLLQAGEDQRVATIQKRNTRYAHRSAPAGLISTLRKAGLRLKSSPGTSART